MDAEAAARGGRGGVDPEAAARGGRGGVDAEVAARGGGGGVDPEAAALGPRWVGRSVPRVEDRRHLTGDATFVDDIRTAGVLHVAFARSPHPAARIEDIDTAEAVRAPGVRAVLTAADLDLEPLTPMLNRPEFVPVELPMLAAERVRHAGEPVAMVIADS